MALDEKTKKEISQLLVLPKTLKSNIELRQHYIIGLVKEKNPERAAARHLQLEKLLKSHYEFIGEQVANLKALEKLKTERKEEEVIIIHLTRQLRLFEQYMQTVWRQRNLIKMKRDNQLALQELQKEMAEEESIIRKIEYHFDKIPSLNKQDKIKTAEIPTTKGRQATGFILKFILAFLAIIIVGLIFKFALGG